MNFHVIWAFRSKSSNYVSSITLLYHLIKFVKWLTTNYVSSITLLLDLQKLISSSKFSTSFKCLASCLITSIISIRYFTLLSSLLHSRKSIFFTLSHVHVYILSSYDLIVWVLFLASYPLQLSFPLYLICYNKFGIIKWICM